jgi:hypothetical protein
MIQAEGKLTTSVQLACELDRNLNRAKAAQFAEILSAL